MGILGWDVRDGGIKGIFEWNKEVLGKGGDFRVRNEGLGVEKGDLGVRNGDLGAQ